MLLAAILSTHKYICKNPHLCCIYSRRAFLPAKNDNGSMDAESEQKRALGKGLYLNAARNYR